MSSGAVEVIDLTGTTDAPSSNIALHPNLPPLPQLPRKARRKLAFLERKRTERQGNKSYQHTPIIISDDDQTEEGSSGTSSQRNKRRKNEEDNREDLEDGEIDNTEAEVHAESGINGYDELGIYTSAKSNGIRPKDSIDSKFALNGRELDRRVKIDRRRPSPPTPFYLDDKPDELLGSSLDNQEVSEPGKRSRELREHCLLLPEHVHLESLSAGAVLEAAITSETEDEDFIYFVDEDRIPTFRYYNDSEEKKRQPDLVCGHCGGEGHKTKECKIVVCLLCGAKDEHETRNCSISKTCFACGMKGHISKDCPDRYALYRRSRDDLGCERCGSRIHNTTECSMIWRLYEYVEDNVRKQTLDLRREKSDLPIGKGGEGYIGEDLWCYNCGEAGHLGDDCRKQRPSDYPREPSAFGRYNTLIGPFADECPPNSSNRRTKYREWEIDGNFDDGYGFSGPSDVGKRGRDKERERMRKRAKETDLTQDDDDDWFGNRSHSTKNQDSARLVREVYNRDEERRTGRSEKRAKIEVSFKSQPSKFELHAPSDGLLSRMSSPSRGKYRERTEEHRQDRKKRREDRRRERERERERGKERHQDRDRGGEKEKERRSKDNDDRSKQSSGPSVSHFNEKHGSRGSIKADDSREEKSRQQYYGGYGS